MNILCDFKEQIDSFIYHRRPDEMLIKKDAQKCLIVEVYDYGQDATQGKNFKQSKAGLNSEFSFSQNYCRHKAPEHSLFNIMVERYNCRPRKDEMIPFPFNENRFSFFCCRPSTSWSVVYNSKSDRSLLSSLKVTQCSTSEMGDVPLYNSCSLPIQVMITGPLPAPSKCKSGRFNAWGHSSTHRTTLWRWWSGSTRLRTPPRRPGPKSSSKRSGLSLMKLPSNVVIPWCNQVAGGRPWVWQQDSAPPHKSKETQACFRRSATTFYPSLTGPFLPRPEPTGLLRLVIRREHHQHDLPQHQSQPDHRHPPSIRRAPAGACGKGMLPVPYRGGNWGWRRLHWIDISSTT